MKKLSLIIVLSLFDVAVMQSQTHTTNETPIVLLTSIESDIILGIELLNNFWAKSENDVLIAYPDCKFYKGLLKGAYDRTESLIIPLTGTLITIYTNEQIFLRGNFLSESELSVGDAFKIGKTKSKIISSKKGELMLKIQ